MLTHCPACQYDLTGLPDRHACPECGYEFDRDSDMVIMFKTNYHMLLFPLILSGFLLLMGISNYFNRGESVILLCSLGFLCSMLIHHFWRPAPQRIAVVTPSEIHFIKGRKVIRRVPLGSVVEAHCSFVDGSICLRDKQGRELLDRPKRMGAPPGQHRTARAKRSRETGDVQLSGSPPFSVRLVFVVQQVVV